MGPQPPNRVLQAHEGSVLWVTFTADGTTLASSSRDNRVIIWDVASGKPTHTLTQPTNDVYCVAYSPDGKLLAACSSDNRIYIWNVPS
jgi:WD40 repeat protein